LLLAAMAGWLAMAGGKASHSSLERYTGACAEDGALWQGLQGAGTASEERGIGRAGTVVSSRRSESDCLVFVVRSLTECRCGCFLVSETGEGGEEVRSWCYGVEAWL
jgi:hypothetical protein